VTEWLRYPCWEEEEELQEAAAAAAAAAAQCRYKTDLQES